LDFIECFKNLYRTVKLTAMITTQILKHSTRVNHAFFTREGGVSKGLYGSLNCGFGSGDHPGNVAINRSRALNRLTGDGELLTLYQVHSSNVVIVEEAWLQKDAPKADAAVTRNPGLALGILTADCVPILLADGGANAGSGVIGAAHAGWKGALAGVVEATVEAMVGLGAQASNITAAIGPSIHQDSYEVGPEFRDRFENSNPANGNFFTSSDRVGYFKFDLVAFVGNKFDALGINFETTGEDTYSDGVRFFSYRRSTHLGEEDYGRGLSAIILADR
jgi:YfiH family protein